jgi:outer membrane protein OmpA-like peptidoglycan-associated protein
MYIQTNRLSGYGQAPVVVKAVEVGSAILSFGRDLFTGGNFSTQSSVVNYLHQNTPLDRKFVTCKRKFRFLAAHPGGPISNAQKKQLGLADSFWFELSYEYNGNDLRNVAVEPLVNKSTTLHKSEFKITFTGNAYSPEREPVAEIVFRISGTWMSWDPVPFMNTLVSFSGNLYVRADGSARLADFKCEDDLVWYDSMTNSCAVAPPYIPPPVKLPVKKYFSLAVLFPFKKHTVSEADIIRINEWYKGWPKTTRDKVERGEILVTIEGFASRPGGTVYNLKLSDRRAESVMAVLRRFTGTNTKFNIKSQGDLSPNIPAFFDVMEWMRRFFNPQKYDQAAVIRFEDVE